MKINGKTHYMWRAVDHEGEVLDAFVTKRRNRKAALKFLRKLMKRYGRPEKVVTENLRSYGAAMKEIGNSDRQRTGSLVKQSRRELIPAFPKKRARHVPLPAHAKFAEIRRRPRLDLQPVQLGTQPPLTTRLQTQPRRRPCGVARSRRGRMDSATVHSETGSN